MENIKERRLRAHMSQADLARRAGVSEKTIKNVEARRVVPQGETARRILGALPASYEEVMRAVASSGDVGARMKTGTAGGGVRVWATAHDDNWALEVDFDCTSYFEEAAAVGLQDLVGDRTTTLPEVLEDLVDSVTFLGCDYPADDVAYHYVGEVAELKVMHDLATMKDTGFECYVDPDSLLAWLKAKHPEVAEWFGPLVEQAHESGETNRFWTREDKAAIGPLA